MKLLRFDILYILLQTFLPGDRKMKIFFLMSFLRLIAEAITPERKHFFFKIASNVVKIDKIHEELSTSHFVT